MTSLNTHAGISSYSATFTGAEPGADRKASSSPKTPVESSPSVDAQRKADDDLAKFLSDVQDDVGLWRPVSKQTSVGKWLEVFNQSWEAPAMQAWIKAQNFVPRSMRLQGSTLTAQKIVDGKPTHVTFTPSDSSGWWPIGRQAIAAAAILDPQQAGLGANSKAVLTLENTMAFYGLSWPLSKAQADEFWVSGFPAVSVADDPIRSPEVREQASREFLDTEQEAELIKTLLGVIKDKPGDEKINLGRIYQAVTPGSSFALANKSRPQLLKDMREHPHMLPILQSAQADLPAQLRLVDGKVYIKGRGRRGKWSNVTAQVRAKAGLASLLDNAIEQAKSTRNIINSGAKADALQLMRFAGMDELPANVTVSELQNLLNWKLNPLPPGSPLGGYGREFLTDARSPEYLNTEQRDRVRRSAGGADAPPKLAVLDCSPQPWAGKTLEQIRENADQLIAQSLAKGAGLDSSESILSGLKNSPSSTSAYDSHSYRQQMILSRDLLRIDPELGLKRNHIAEYELYSAANSGKTLSQVRTELEIHISSSAYIPMNQAVLITHALLATVAPEFLVKGAGEERVGSLALVNLRTQTALVELASAGSSRHMSAEQISSRAYLSPLTADHQQLHTVESAGPIYDWALAQGVVSAEENYLPSAVKRALTYYNQRLAEYAGMSSDLDNARAVFTSRLEAGRQELERVSPGNDDFFKKRTIYAEPDSWLYDIGKSLLNISASVSDEPLSIVSGKPVSSAERVISASSIYDLYISGILTADNINTTQWKFASTEARMKFESLKPQLSRLKPIGEVFDGKFNAGAEHLEKFKLMSTRVMMSEMPLEDRALLTYGKVLVFGAAEYQRPAAGGLTQEQAQQKMGPIIYATDGTIGRCYEFLPSTNSYILRPQLLEGMASLARVYREQIKPSALLLKAQYPTLPADISVKGYFPADTRGHADATQAPNSYSSQRTNEMIQMFKDNGLFLNRELMLTNAKGTTNIERIQQRFDATESFIINTLIPFKSNIEDIASGDPKRVALGGIGLGLELFGALFVVAGAISAAAKGTSLAFKLGQFGKAALSMFNLPGAIADTGKAAFHLSSIGIKSLAKSAPKSFAKGLSDFRKLASGSQRPLGQSRLPWTAEKTKGLLGNTGLINTGIGTHAFIQQHAPAQSAGTTLSDRT